jgi:hypothetical protein
MIIRGRPRLTLWRMGLRWSLQQPTQCGTSFLSASAIGAAYVLPLGLHRAKMAADIPDSDLELLLRVLRQALQEAGASAGSDATGLSGRLGQVIMETYARGERDPEKLKQAALDSL